MAAEETMSRWVVPQRAGVVAEAEAPPDGSLARVVKFVPVEVVSAYTLLFGLLASANFPKEQILPGTVGLIVLFLIVTIAYVWRDAPQGPSRTGHLIVSPLAFLAWAYPISSALLGSLFIGLISFALQAVVIALSIFIKPHE